MTNMNPDSPFFVDTTPRNDPPQGPADPAAALLPIPTPDAIAYQIRELLLYGSAAPSDEVPSAVWVARILAEANLIIDPPALRVDLARSAVSITASFTPTPEFLAKVTPAPSPAGRYVVGHNMPGYLPENTPWLAPDAESARQVMIDRLIRDADYCDNEEAAEQLDAAGQLLNLDNLTDGWDVTIDGYAYWIRPATATDLAELDSED